MANPVKLRTAVPTLSEFGKSLGISGKRQRALVSLVKREASSGKFVAVRKGDSRSGETVKSEEPSRAKP